MVGEMPCTTAQAFLPRKPIHGGSDAASKDSQTSLKHCHNVRPIFVQLCCEADSGMSGICCSDLIDAARDRGYKTLSAWNGVQSRPQTGVD